MSKHDDTDPVERVLAGWRTVYPEQDPAPLAIIGRLLILAGQLQSSVEEALRPHKLKLGQFDILATLRRAGPNAELTPTELLRSVVLSSGGMTSRLDRLEQAKLIVRKPDPTDRRGILVSLTEMGKKLIDAATKSRFAEAKKSLPNLSKRDLDKLTQYLTQWLAERRQEPVR